MTKKESNLQLEVEEQVERQERYVACDMSEQSQHLFLSFGLGFKQWSAPTSLIYMGKRHLEVCPQICQPHLDLKQLAL